MNRITSKRRRRIRTQLPQVCVQCGTLDNLTIDHINPRVFGGTNTLDNLQMLCLPCHHTKTKAEIPPGLQAPKPRKAQQLAGLLTTAQVAATRPTLPAPQLPAARPDDLPHLLNLATGLNWSLIAALMKALNWRWYHIKGRTPRAPEIRTEALARLTDLIHEARQGPRHTATLRTGGLEYTATVCAETGQVERLCCAFVPECYTSTNSSHLPAAGFHASGTSRPI